MRTYSRVDYILRHLIDKDTRLEQIIPRFKNKKSEKSPDMKVTCPRRSVGPSVELPINFQSSIKVLAPLSPAFGSWRTSYTVLTTLPTQFLRCIDREFCTPWRTQSALAHNQRHYKSRYQTRVGQILTQRTRAPGA
jgi:hypothetical protein